MEEKLKTWHFAFDNDHLVDLVLKGIKRATTYLYDKNDPLSEIGYRDILIYENEKKMCITKTTNIRVLKFKDVNEEMARLEGEGDLSLEYYRKVHFDYFKKIDNSFNDETLIVFEEFVVDVNLAKQRMNIAKMIVDNNKLLFGEVKGLKEINAGFNNALFEVDDKYIIKICQNLDLEDTFKKENDFYKNNQFDFMPKLYLYDDTKKIVPYIYEVIEKIKGKSLYYHWYKMRESERENIVAKLCQILKQLYAKKYDGYAWNEYLRSSAVESYKMIEKYFNDDDKKVIIEAINTFDKYLADDNRFCLIHNDLHFDNILICNDKLYLIDFNDIMIAPFDYDFRILFMCKDIPAKWANIEMDPYQKAEDYKNIDKYLLRHYPDLGQVKFLKERMEIYRLVRDMKCLVNYHEQELIDSVKLFSSRLIAKK